MRAYGFVSCLGKDTELGAFTSIRLDASDGSKVGGNSLMEVNMIARFPA